MATSESVPVAPTPPVDATTVDMTPEWMALSLSLALLTVTALMTYYFSKTAFAISKQTTGDTTEIRRMFFAAAILTGLGCLFIESMILYHFSRPPSTSGKDIFDACKTILPPLIALVIGYFFGKSDDHRKPAPAPQAPPADAAH